MLWRDRYMRRLTYRMAILGALRDGREMTARGLLGATGLRHGQLYPALDHLQEHGRVQARWIVDQPAYPPMYRLVEDT